MSSNPKRDRFVKEWHIHHVLLVQECVTNLNNESEEFFENHPLLVSSNFDMGGLQSSVELRDVLVKHKILTLLAERIFYKKGDNWLHNDPWQAKRGYCS